MTRVTVTWIALVALLAVGATSAILHTAERRATASAEAPLLPPTMVASVRDLFPH